MDSEEVSAGGETSIASEVLIADHLNEMFTNMTELRKVYILNCKLNEKRDEEFNALQEEFAALGKELEETKLTLKSERSVKRLIRNKLQLTNEELGIKEAQLVKCQRELKYAREDQESKDVEIAGLMNVIADLRVCRDLHSGHENHHSDSSDEEEPELSLPRSHTTSRSSLFEMLALSPIPEENPDEIPGYYDICQAYMSSLHISIGSDSKLDKAIIEAMDDQLPYRRHRKKSKSLENISSASASSDKENSQQMDGRKKKKKTTFSSMFNLAHY